MRSIHKSTLKRFLSTLLAVVLVLGTLPFAAFAEGEDAVAQVGGTTYPTLAAAIDAAVDGDTVTLLTDATGSGIKINTSTKSITIDLGGHTYTVTAPTVGSTGTETNGFQLLTGGALTIQNGTLKAGTDSAKILIQNYCNLTLDNVTVDCREVSTNLYALSNNCGNITIKGATNIYANPGHCAFDVYYWSASYPQGVTVTFDDSFTGTVNGTIEYGTDGTTNAENHAEKAALTIRGNGTFIGTFSTYALQNVPAKITISGGSFSSSVSEYVIPSLTAELYSTTKNAAAPYSYYASVDQAMAAARPGDTITDLNDSTAPAITVTEVTALTVVPGTVQVNGQFIAQAKTSSGEGKVEFTYGTQTQIVDVQAAQDGTGVASCTFVAQKLANEKVTATHYSDTQKSAPKECVIIVTENGLDVTKPVITFESVNANVKNLAGMPVPATPEGDADENGAYTYTLPATAPTSSTHKFTGWVQLENDGTEGTRFQPGDEVSIATNTTFKAKWTWKQVSITNDSDSNLTGVTIDGLTEGDVNITSEQSFTVKLEKGYDPSTLTVTANEKTLAAVESTVNGNGSTTYTYKFTADEDTTITVSQPSVYTFTVTMPVGANFTATFGDGTVSKTIEYGGNYVIKVTPSAGYEIGKVYVNSVELEAESTDGNGTAKYRVKNVTEAQNIQVFVDEIPVYTVTYVVNDAQYTTQKVASGMPLTLPEDPVVTGYTFGGWFTAQNGGGDKVTTSTTVSGDMTVYAQLTAKTYTIKYSLNYEGATPIHDGTSKTYGTAAILRGGSNDGPMLSLLNGRTGYTILGWSRNKNATTATYQPGDWFSEEITEDITLYAVWKVNTYTVTLPVGTGYSVQTNQSTTVEYGDDFEFTVVVDRAYAATEPTVSISDTNAGKLTKVSGETKDTEAATWEYKITDITDNQIVNISVTQNEQHTVTFVVNGVTSQTQQVEHGYPVAQPTAPSVDGYTFEGWQWDYDNDPDTDLVDYVFTTPVTSDITLIAKLTAIKPTVTIPASDLAGVDWVIQITEPENKWSSTEVDYGSNVTFKVYVKEAYDGSNMQVGANGALVTPSGNPEVSPYNPTTMVYTYTLYGVKENTTISVSGVTRKTVTITYNDNGGFGGPGQEQVPYYASALSDNGAITDATPTREGYSFKEWNTKSDGADTAYAPGAANKFTSDTTLYAIWTEDTVTVTYPATDAVPDGVTVSKNGAETVTKGSTQTFSVTLDEGYDPATLSVTANGVPLAAVRENGTNNYYYTFKADADTTIIKVSTPKKYQYTVTLPTGDHFTAEFENETIIDTVDHGENSRTFTVTAATDWNITAVYANGVKLEAQTDTNNNKYYLVTDVTANTVVSISVQETVWRTVTYFLDDAGVYAQVQVENGSEYTPLELPEVEGYTVTGWYENPDYTGTPVAPESSITVTSDLSLYAKKVANIYHINYDLNLNGGDPSGEQPVTLLSTPKPYGQAVQLLPTVPTRTGYTFLGWGLTPNDTVAAYAPGATFSAEIRTDVYLFAIWQVNTYTVTLPSGTGYSISTSQSTTVEYGGSFEFTVIVDRAYATTTPVVSWTRDNGEGGKTLTYTSEDAREDGSIAYTYKMTGIKANRIVSVTVAQNKTYTVTFYTITNDTSDLALHLTQEVEDTYRVEQPTDPVIEGYTFQGWYVWTDSNSDGVIDSTDTTSELAATEYNFSTAVTGDLLLVGKMTRNTYDVTWPQSGGTGWTAAITAPTGIAVSPFTVNHGDKVTFTVTVKEGYDASAMQVGVNGKLWAPDSVTASGKDTVYTYTIPAVTEATDITVTGVVRKTVTITYNANALDDVSGMPEQQVVNYYLSGGDNTKITNQKPTRTGYEFLGWSTDSEETIPTYSNPKADLPDSSYTTRVTANFTTDTTLYAVWKEKATNITLTVDTDAQYEGEEVTLTATVTTGTGDDETAVTSGSVEFYRVTTGESGEVLTSLGTASVNGGIAELTVETSAFVWEGSNTDTYAAKFIPDEGKGYSEAKSDSVTVIVKSAAITWQMASGIIYNNSLTIYEGNSATGDTTGTMTAGQTYTLKLPAVFPLDATDVNQNLTAGTGYTVTWQKKAPGQDWTTIVTGGGDTYIVTSYEYGTQYQAIVVPLAPYTKAAAYGTDGALVTTEYALNLTTEATAEVAQQATETALAVTDTHDLTNDSTTTKAEFEGQKVTLTATVTANGQTVTTGEVYFYKVGTSDTLIGKANVQSDGTAVLEAEISTYSADAKDTFTAVYQNNATYKTSASTDVEVRIRSTAIAWTTNDAGEVNTLIVNDADGNLLTDSMVANRTYTLTLPTVVEDGQPSVELNVGVDYLVAWYQKNAEGNSQLLEGGTMTDSYTVTPSTAGLTYYAVVTPKTGSDYTDAYQDNETESYLATDETEESVLEKTTTKLAITGADAEAAGTLTFAKDHWTQYEGQTVTLTATVKETGTGTPAVQSGAVRFYRYVDGTNDAFLDEVALNNNGEAILNNVTISPYDTTEDVTDNRDLFYAVYVGTPAYETSTSTSDTTIVATEGYRYYDKTSGNYYERVFIKSTAISWKNENDIAANTLIIKQGTTTVTKMIAGQTYTLELPAIYALDGRGPLAIGQEYTVTWQYLDGQNTWINYVNSAGSAAAQITSQFSGYQFRAIVEPVIGTTSDFTKAAKYTTAENVDTLVDNDYFTYLTSDPTPEVELQETTTKLAITGADAEAAGTLTFAKDHWTQYEGQTVTLTATVKETGTGTPAVQSGVVRFYRYVDGTNDAFLGEVALDTNGEAILNNVTISAYDANEAVTKNLDLFYAVYVGTPAYETSTSTSDTTIVDTEGYRYKDKTSGNYYERVFIKSTKIQTPVIDAKSGTTAEGSTTYNDDLTGLLAGVSHTFTLRTGATTADYSVVALDGRTVAPENYTIQWNVKTGDNTVTDNTVGGIFTTTNNKVGDEIYVTLNPAGDMTVGADSKKAIIGAKQDVTVAVTASADTVYQRNDITLTATVKGVETDATMQPTGNVTFYYTVDNGTTWKEIGTATLSKNTVSGEMEATLNTVDLPVKSDTNTLQNVIITAIYSGDDTFKANDADHTTNKTVTVYSSVVYVNSAVENIASAPEATVKTNGIVIYPESELKANETNVKLLLSDIYTLDYADKNADSFAKLTEGTDYTVEWQYTLNYAAFTADPSTATWNTITTSAGTTCTISTVAQGAAYRAVITVLDAEKVQGSYTSVDQGTVGEEDINDGRKVYYSNILVAALGQPNVTVSVTTSNQTEGYEGIVEGETATIHTFVSGATLTTPISKMTATITDANDNPTVIGEKDNVNGYTYFEWTPTVPGCYTLTVTAESSNGYEIQTITRTLIVRDDNYTLTVKDDSKVYNGSAQGIDWELTGVDIEDTLAQASVVVRYTQNGKLVEPTKAGEYDFELILPESAYWTEHSVQGTFTIEQREVSVVDLIAQAKVYDVSTNANIQEIILEDAKTNQDSLSDNALGVINDTGVINGDSVYAVGTGYTESADAGETKLGVKDVTLMGDDANNYTLVNNYTEDFNIQRNQLKGDIAAATYKYTGSNFDLPADDVYLIDQSGKQVTDYTVTYYYHNGEGMEEVDALNQKGMYTVIVSKGDNYKGGASQTVYVAGTAKDAEPSKTAESAIISITDTVKLYDGKATGAFITTTSGSIDKVTYNGSETVPSAAGRYLVKVTTSTGDTAYGIYTIVKANPVLSLNAEDVTYDSAPYAGVVSGSYNGGSFPEGTYFTYAGGFIQGVAYEPPTEAGDYVITAHVPETANYAAHEVSANFTIEKADLTITAKSLQRHLYSAYPDMVADYAGLATGGVAPDTSLRDVQIQPEFVYSDFSNFSQSHVGTYTVTPVSALARNYNVKYVAGEYAVTENDPQPQLAIHGAPVDGNGDNVAFYDDVIQLYAYGNTRGNVINGSSILTWSVDDSSPATIDAQSGLLTVTGVGTITVTLTRGTGAQQISTRITIEAKAKEVTVVLTDRAGVYNGKVRTYGNKADNIAIVNELYQDVTELSLPSNITIANNTRTDIGSQIVTGTVTSDKYVSETYGALYSLYAKEATVAPVAQTTEYGTKETYDTQPAYTVTGTANNVDPVTGVVVASVTDAYDNLDVLDGYEILVAGTENMNYNVKYVTDQDAPDAAVTAKTLTIQTGSYDDTVGMTGGSLNPAGDYPAEGAVVDPSAVFETAGLRMYGEPNQVMGYNTLTSLISGDSVADLEDLLEWLVEYKELINAGANVKYENHDTAPQLMTGKTAYEITSDMTFGNYTVTVINGTQNIYQRPVTLSLPDAASNNLNVSFNLCDDEATLKEAILNTLIVGKYGDVGGLAELLNHTIRDLNLQFEFSEDGGTPVTFPLKSNTTYNVKVTIGNPNYWLANGPFEFDLTVLPYKYEVQHDAFDANHATVTFIKVNEDGTRVEEWLPNGVTVYCEIYETIPDASYSEYVENGTLWLRKAMVKTGVTGQYTVEFNETLTFAGWMFAIPDSPNYVVV